MDARQEVQITTQPTESALIAWLQENALPLDHVEAGNGFADLQPLRAMLKDVKVVGLGEATHGTREVCQLKHRLVEFLVTQMDFTIFTIEASHAACQPINDYLLYGRGDLATVLSGQWYVPWDSEEMATMLAWMRAYNQSVAGEKKVTFYGLDTKRNDNGRKAVLDYLHKVAPDQVAATAHLFEALAHEENKWPSRLDDNFEKTQVQLFPQLQAVSDFLTANQERFVKASSLQEFSQALRFTRVMQQWIIGNSAELRPLSWDGGTARSNYMAENLIYLTEQASPNAKFIVSEHNAHLRVANPATEAPNMGTCLREEFGQAYFALGVEFNQGAFQTRMVLPQRIFGDLKEVTLPPSPVHSLAWYLAHAEPDLFLLNLRTPVDNPLVAKWLDQPQPIHFVSWVFDDQATDYLEMRSPNDYDGLIFIESTTATRPTANALKKVANREAV